MAAGFRRKRKLIRLTFEGDADLDGLEVTLTSLPLGEFLELTGYGDDGREMGVGDMLRRFAAALVDWNLQEEDGTEVPATEAAVMAEDHDQMLTVANAWLDAVRGVRADDPLSESSPDGGLSLEASIPMDAPSQSLAS